MKNAINIYGKENFVRHIIKFYSNKIETAEAETKLITKEMINSDNWYNTVEGGNAWDISANLSRRRVIAGTHNFQGDKNPSRRKVKEGKHHFSGNTNPMKIASKNGTHHLKNLAPWKHNIASINSKLHWFKSDILYEIYEQDKSIGFRKLTKAFNLNNLLQIQPYITTRILNKFRKGWIPSQDPEWVKFKMEFKQYVTL